MGLEYERKFAATAEQFALLLARCPEGETIRMETTYFDTPDRALSARRWTLRLRLENGQAVCTVKTADTGHGRGEWEVLCPDIREAVPLLVARGAPAELAGLAKPGLIPTCGARFTRRAVPLELGDVGVELALDQGELIGGVIELPFREVEVELKRGTPEDADRFADRLARQLGLVPQEKSKFRRAAELAEGGNHG